MGGVCRDNVEEACIKSLKGNFSYYDAVFVLNGGSIRRVSGDAKVAIIDVDHLDEQGIHSSKLDENTIEAEGGFLIV